MTVSRAALIALALAGVPVAARADANLLDIRIAKHDEHMRIVFDLDAPVTYTSDEAGKIAITGLAAGSAVLNAEDNQAPLKRIVLTPQDGTTLVTIESAEALSPRPFLMKPDEAGGNRLVIDLYPEAPRAGAATAEAAHGADGDAHASTQAEHSAPAPAETAHAAPVPLAGSAAVPPNARAAVASPVESHGAPAQRHDGGAQAAVAPDNMPPAIDAPLPQGMSPSGTSAAITPGEPQISNAEAALERGDYRSACGTADALVAAAARDLRALAVQGFCRLGLGDALGAKQSFAAALEIDPGFSRARIGAAETEAKLGNRAGARIHYQRVLADHPPTDVAYRIVDALEALDHPPANAAAAVH